MKQNELAALEQSFFLLRTYETCDLPDTKAVRLWFKVLALFAILNKKHSLVTLCPDIDLTFWMQPLLICSSIQNLQHNRFMFQRDIFLQRVEVMRNLSMVTNQILGFLERRLCQAPHKTLPVSPRLPILKLIPAPKHCSRFNRI